ncbi:MAG: hypothetical protein ACYDGR_08845 [Candidatus Dormibacteria bacterium]
MPLDIDRRRRLAQLLDHYGGLLTEHQRETLRLNLERDWSYAEIAAAQGVSRTAVYDIIRRSEGVLEDYELKLGLMARDADRQTDRARLVARLEDLQGELKDLRKTVKELS